MTDKKRDAGSLKLLGGRPCLDFVNTLDWRGTDSPQEFLRTYDDLVSWSRHAGICSQPESRNLYKMAEQSNSEAKKVLNRALKLREAIYRLFAAGTANQKPLNEDLVVLNNFQQKPFPINERFTNYPNHRWLRLGYSRQPNQIGLDIESHYPVSSRNPGL